jgi:hypothetical protein
MDDFRFLIQEEISGASRNAMWRENSPHSKTRFA